MESLSEETWDLVIAGTSLPQSLLALSLSRSEKKVLHVDQHAYYGGDDAGLNLQDAETWVKEWSTRDTTLSDGGSTFSDVRLATHIETTGTALGPTRSYTLSLNPQIIYAQSALLPTLVSSQIHSQLEFLAVGPWWVHRAETLHKIPSSREDVFNDEAISMRDKRSLMKFLRFVLQDEESQQQRPEQPPAPSLAFTLATRFNIPRSLRSPLLALSLSQVSAAQTEFEDSLTAIKRHMRSIGYFGPGFGAVVAKYGGNAEIAQVACRAQAVGGGVYLLGHAVTNIERCQDRATTDTNTVAMEELLRVTLSDGTVVKTRHIAGGHGDLPLPAAANPDASVDNSTSTIHSIDVISDPLKHLFPATSENGPVPAVAIVLVDDEAEPENPPVYLQIHSEETGECPNGQSIIYGSVRQTHDSSRQHLITAVRSLLQCSEIDRQARVLWNMTYVSGANWTDEANTRTHDSSASKQIHVFESRPFNIAMGDEVLTEVKSVWECVLGDESKQQTFLRFEEREQQPET